MLKILGIIGAIVIGMSAIVCAVVAAMYGLMGPHAWGVSGALLGAVFAVAMSATTFINKKPEDNKNPDDSVAPAIAVNITAFLTFAIAAIVAATDKWPIALFWAGAFMLGGGFVGLLFGIPISASAVANNPSANPPP